MPFFIIAAGIIGNIFLIHHTLILYIFNLGILSFLLLNYYFIYKKITHLEILKINFKRSLRFAHHVWLHFFKVTNNGVALLNNEGKIITANHNFISLLSLNKKNKYVLNMFSILYHTDEENFNLNLKKLLAQDMPAFQSLQKFVTKDGEEKWFLIILSLLKAKNKKFQFMLQIQDFTVQKQAEERLLNLLYENSQTGFAHIHLLERFIRLFIADAQRELREFSLLLIQLDSIHFQLPLLKLVEQRLQSILRANDIILRYSANEFVILLKNVNTVLTAKIAQKILQTLSQPIVQEYKDIYLTGSIGIAIYPKDGNELSLLLKSAQEAVNLAKSQGGNQYQFQNLTHEITQYLTLQTDLNYAVKHQELQLAYLPKMEIKNRKITGVLVLLQWQKFQSQEILTLALESEEIFPIYEWLITEALADLRVWYERGFTSLILSLTLPLKALKQINFFTFFTQMLKAYHLPASALEIEIDAPLLAHEGESLLASLSQFKKLGIVLSLTHVNQSYFSFDHLLALNINKIKIPASYIKGIEIDEKSRALIKAFIAFAKPLNIKTLAMGVSNKIQYEFLLQEGCDEMEGAYLSEPLNEEEMLGFLFHPIPQAEALNEKIEEKTHHE